MSSLNDLPYSLMAMKRKARDGDAFRGSEVLILIEELQRLQAVSSIAESLVRDIVDLTRLVSTPEPPQDPLPAIQNPTH